MYQYYRHVLIGLLCTLLLNCQTIPGQSLFTTHPNDNMITTAVLEAMLDDENLSTVKVHVETNQAIVTLTGYVKTIRQSDTAEEIARKTPGVTEVHNEIVVRK